MGRWSLLWVSGVVLLAACDGTQSGVADGAIPDAGMEAGPDLGRDSSSAADASTADGLITGLVQTFKLGAANTLGYGLGYDEASTPHRLYVSDQYDHVIYAYDVGKGGLTPNASANINTKALDSRFLGPRGLAFTRTRNSSVLFALTSSDADGDKSFTSRLWKIDLSGSGPTVDSLDLNQPAFQIAGAEVFGLAGSGESLLVSYDTSRLASARDQVRQGIFRLKVGGYKVGEDYWTYAKAGHAWAAGGHIPHSGRKVNQSTYPRAPAFGLAAGTVEGYSYLFGTSYHKYLYAAELATGRGLFHWWSPGAKAIYGLAFGDGHLWALDRISGADQVHKIRASGSWGAVTTGSRHVRRLRMKIKSTALSSSSSAGVTHNYALAHPSSARPNQGVDESSYKTSKSAGATVAKLSYDPAADPAARQQYYAVSFVGPAKAGEQLSSGLEVDFWSSARRQYVYPHRVDASSPPAPGYLADSKLVYGLSDKATYDLFIAAVKAAVSEEYGYPASSATNRYWIARNVMEFLLERYKYGNVSSPLAGHFGYNPANLKLALSLDTVSGNEKMSCSTSTFAMSGVLRYLGIPTRWVGTTKLRGGWDTDGDNYRTEGEGALDTSFHRWPEVWLGAGYGWQRFDPTPYSGGPGELSQYQLMTKAAQGVGWTDLVLTLGSGLHEPFFRQKDGNQRYNSVPRYTSPAQWSDSTYRHITWSNPCTLKIVGPLSSVKTKTPTVTWQAKGRWDLDPTATVSIYLQQVTAAGGGGWTTKGSLQLLASGIPYGTGSRQVSLSSVQTGLSYRFEIRKDGDAYTGSRGSVFSYSP